MKRTFLDISTSHVSKVTADWLDEQGRIAATAVDELEGPEIHIGKHVYGWFFYADEEPNDELWPADVCAIMRYARSQGCEYVMLDRDADTIEELPSYDW